MQLRYNSKMKVNLIVLVILLLDLSQITNIVNVFAEDLQAKDINAASDKKRLDVISGNKTTEIQKPSNNKVPESENAGLNNNQATEANMEMTTKKRKTIYKLLKAKKKDSMLKSQANDPSGTDVAPKLRNYVRDYSLNVEEQKKVLEISKGIFLDIKGRNMYNITKKIHNFRLICRAINNMSLNQTENDKLKNINFIINSLNISLKFESLKKMEDFQKVCNFLGKIAKKALEKTMKKMKNYLDINSKEHSEIMIRLVKVIKSKSHSLFMCLGNDWFKHCSHHILLCLNVDKPNLCVWKYACGGKSLCLGSPKNESISSTTTPSAEKALVHQVLKTAESDCDSLKECLVQVNFSWKGFIEDFHNVKLPGPNERPTHNQSQPNMTTLLI